MTEDDDDTDLAVVVEARVGRGRAADGGVLLGQRRKAELRRRRSRVLDVRRLRTIADLVHDGHLEHLLYHVTPRHVTLLVEYPNFRDIREKYFTVSSLADLFNRADNHTISISIY